MRDGAPGRAVDMRGLLSRTGGTPSYRSRGARREWLCRTGEGRGSGRVDAPHVEHAPRRPAHPAPHLVSFGPPSVPFHAPDAGARPRRGVGSASVYGVGLLAPPCVGR
ncbi:hypothetical protein MOPEL_130_01250 [Mobilicoccus pelagius NBRC 104925]|uniref:Uncharacterized protein n=1 Tax=Mobilicoccus pelagius NBRC 104925 TaxID=1089455 RepID=H5UUW0_9MICO|nr:hypothetical protein MOPEL_130_01250 [Mobilicoccus pelagius NBRC 104925]